MNNNKENTSMLSVEAAANEIKSGDTIWVGCESSISKSFLDALAERHNELNDVTILAERGDISCKFLEELKYKKSFRVLSFFTEALIETYKSGNKADFFKFTAPKTIDAICKQFNVNTIAVAVCPPDENGNCNVGKSGNYITPLINNYSGITKRIAIIDQNLPMAIGIESETVLPASAFDLVSESSIA